MLNDNQQRIDAYLRGKMSESERIQFEKELKDNDRLRQNFEIFKQLQTTLAEREAMKEKMRKWDLEVKAQKRLRMRRWSMAGVSVAACLALGLFALKPLLPHDTNHPDFAPSYGASAGYRGTNSDIMTLDELIDAEKNDMALSVCDSLLEEYRSTLQGYEVADTLSKKELYDKSATELNIYEIEWRKINILLSIGRKKEAQELLRVFASKDGKYRKEAEQLLDK